MPDFSVKHVYIYIKVLVIDSHDLELLMRKFEGVEGVQREQRWDTDEELLASE
jgi:hypothetical protein